MTLGGSRRFAGGLGAGIVALAIWAASLAGSASAESEPVSCAYVEAGAPGPADNELRIEDGTRSATSVFREGDAIVVYSNAHTDPIVCSGTAPTVFNIDRIEYTATATAAPFFGTLGSQPLAPGATAEPSGSEIEVEIKEAYPDGVLNVSGTNSDDSIETGLLGRHRIGVNLNVSADGGQPDADVVLDTTDPGRASVRVTGRNGDDEISALGGDGFTAPLLADRVGFSGGNGNDNLIGGPSKDRLAGNVGDDVLLGGRGRDYLTIGPGRDLARGGAGPDQIFNQSDVGGIPPDRGPDRVFAGAGNDRIDVEQPLAGDRVDCGPGRRDFVFVDPGDRTSACEEVDVIRR